MDKELKQQLEWMNANLNAIVLNQAMIFEELKQMEREIGDREKEK